MRYEKKIPIIILSLIGFLSIFSLSDEVSAQSLGLSITATAEESSDIIYVTRYAASDITDVTFRITSPSGNNVLAIAQVSPDNNGDFTVIFEIKETWTEDGFYEIEAMQAVHQNSLYTLNVLVEVNNGLAEKTSVTESNLETEINDSNDPEPSISVTTNRSSYDHGDIVVITGKISEYDPTSGGVLTFIIKSPENNLVILRQLVPKSDGSFEFSFTAGGPQWKYNGDYIVAFSFGSISGETKINYVGGEQVISVPEPEPTPKLESQPDSKSITIPAPFVDESKDPRYYIDRYNNEPSYKKWFDDNYPEYDSIYQAVGLENSKFTEPFDTLESNIPEGSSQIIPGTDSSIWDTRDDGFTINYPTGWLFDQGKRTGSGEYRYVISFFNPEDTAQITITKIFYPEMFITMDLFYDMFDNPEKYNLVLDKDIEENFFSVFILMEISELLQCEYNYEDDYGCTDFTLNALRLFENDGGLPALQIEYSYAEKLFGDNITYGYSSLITKYYLQDRPFVIYSDSPLNDYDQLRSYFIDAANSFSIKDGAENKLSDKIKSRLLSDMKSFPNSSGAKKINDSYKQEKGYSIPIIEYDQASSETKTPKGGGCLIATATYGSELAPQVQQLRELRDNSLLQTESGTSFIESFNQFYYSFSPIIADYERENPLFREAVKIAITPMISSLSILNYVDMDSESQVLVYGISLIILNIGMYFVTPAIIVWRIKSIQ